jgi:hypothetical protein
LSFNVRALCGQHLSQLCEAGKIVIEIGRIGKSQTQSQQNDKYDVRLHCLISSTKVNVAKMSNQIILISDDKTLSSKLMGLINFQLFNIPNLIFRVLQIISLNVVEKIIIKMAHKNMFSNTNRLLFLYRTLSWCIICIQHTNLINANCLIYVNIDCFTLHLFASQVF